MIYTSKWRPIVRNFTIPILHSIPVVPICKYYKKHWRIIYVYDKTWMIILSAKLVVKHIIKCIFITALYSSHVVNATTAVGITIYSIEFWGARWTGGDGVPSSCGVSSPRWRALKNEAIVNDSNIIVMFFFWNLILFSNDKYDKFKLSQGK